MNNTPCQFCPFAEASIYLSLPPKKRCTLTGEFHMCDNTECDVKRKMIPIEWIKKYIEDNTNVVKNPKYDGWYFTEEPIDYYIKFRPYDIEFMLNKWEKENETV